MEEATIKITTSCMNCFTVTVESDNEELKELARRFFMIGANEVGYIFHFKQL